MTKNQVVAQKSPLLPYEFAKTQRVIAFEKDQRAQVISEQPLSKDLFQELQELNKETSAIKLNNDSINKLVDVISQPMNPKQRPTKFEVDNDIPFLQQLQNEQNKKEGE